MPPWLYYSCFSCKINYLSEIDGTIRSPKVVYTYNLLLESL